ncbi:hypothetical protein ACNKHW_01670 [Shigella flexneri]
MLVLDYTNSLRHLVFGGSRGHRGQAYAPFYDLIQTALSHRIKSLSNDFTAMGCFSGMR